MVMGLVAVGLYLVISNNAFLPDLFWPERRKRDQKHHLVSLPPSFETTAQ